MPVVPKVTRSRSSTPDQDSDGSTLYNGESGQYESASTMDYNSPSIKLNNHSKPSNRWSSSVVSEVSSSDRRTEEIPVSLPKWSGYQTAAKESLSPSKPQTLKKSNLKKDKGDIEAWLDKYNRENGGGAPLKPIQEDEDAPLFAIKQKITKNRKEIQSMVDSTTKSDEEEQPLEMVCVPCRGQM